MAWPELNPRLVGTISGVMNTSGNLAGIFGPTTAGAIVAGTDSWTLPFYDAAPGGLFHDEGSGVQPI